MNMYRKKVLIIILGAAALAFFLFLVMMGQRSVSFAGLGIMLAGLAGILILLYLYNRHYAEPREKNRRD